MNDDIAVYLTPKQRAFCDEYMQDRNATAAALRAGYSAGVALNGYLMTIPKIKQCLKTRCEASAERAQVSHDMVLRELCKIAFGNMRDYFLPAGGLKPVHELTDDQAAALWSTSIGTKADGTETHKIRMYNKLAALDKVAKHLNFYDTEQKEREKEYVYLDDELLTRDDAYDDENYIADDEKIPDLPLTGDGQVFCDNCDHIRFKVDLNETYDENVGRMAVYETQLGRPIKHVKINAADDADQTRQPLWKEIKTRLRKKDSKPVGFDTLSLQYNFTLLRELEAA